MSLRILFIFNFIANVYQVDLNVLLALFSIGPQFSILMFYMLLMLSLLSLHCLKSGVGHKERAILKEFVI